MNTCNRQSHQTGSWYLVTWLYPDEALSFITITGETSQHTVFACSFPEMSSLQTRGRKLKRVAAVGLLVQNSALVLMVKKPTARQFSSNCIPLTLMSLHNAPALIVGSPVSYHHKYWKRGGGSTLPSRREPSRFLVVVLVRELRAEWRELPPPPPPSQAS